MQPQPDDDVVTLVGEHGELETTEAEPPVLQYTERKWKIRPRPRYCKHPNCGRRPEPGGAACVHHRGRI